MKKIILMMIILICFVYYAYGEKGLYTDFNIDGTSIGSTKIQGRITVIVQSQVKRIKAELIYIEAGSPFPEVDEEEAIVDFINMKKYIFSMGSGQWITNSLKDDYKILNERGVRISIKKKKNEINIKANFKLPRRHGGSQKFNITYIYADEKMDRVDKALEKNIRPTAIDFLGLFLDNEELIELISKKMGKDKYRIPKFFKCKWSQGNKKKLDITGEMMMKKIIDSSKYKFKP